MSGHSPVIPSPLSGGMFSRSNGSNASLGGFGIPPIRGGDEEEIDEDVPLPTFDVRPAMLAVDLALLPGESRSCECFFILFYFFLLFRLADVGFGYGL